MVATRRRGPLVHCTARRMKRTCLLIGWIGAGLFSAPRAVAQDDDVQVWLLGLFAMAHFPLLKEVDNMRHPTGPTEYRLFSYWVMDKWGDRSPRISTWSRSLRTRVRFR